MLLEGIFDERVESKVKTLSRGETLSFNIEGSHYRLSDDCCESMDEVTVYNPTKPIQIGEKQLLIGRIESRNREDNSRSVVFQYNTESNIWEIQENGLNLPLQDPFYCGDFIDEDSKVVHVFGGVRLKKDKGHIVGWNTVFYKFEGEIENICKNGACLKIKPFAIGPRKMKDIRIIQLSDGQIGVFPRPQSEDDFGGYGGRGKIGYFQIAQLNELEGALHNFVDKQDDKLLFGDLFGEGEWGGANELHLLSNGKIGVLCHVAQSKNQVRNYAAASFVFDPKTLKYSTIEVLATADDFEAIEPKKADLGKVVFSGGLRRNDDQTAWLYVGIGDAKVGRILIEDPFNKYEVEMEAKLNDNLELLPAMV